MSLIPQPSITAEQPGIKYEKISSWVNHIPGVIYRCRGDESVTLEFFSDEIENLTGYPVDYFMQHRNDGYSKLVYDADRDANIEIIRKAIIERTKFEIEYRIVHKNGELRWVFECGKGTYHEKENLVLVDGCIFDISKRKQTEATLSIESDIKIHNQTQKEQEELLQRLTLATNSAAIGIFEIDFAHKQVIWDDRMYEIYGIKRSQGLNLFKVYFSSLHPDDQAMMAKIIDEFLTRKREINGTVYRIILPDGRRRYIESYASIRKTESGNIVSLIGTNRDITDAVLVQEKIKAQNKVLRDIAFIQSHEVRRPLANIFGVIEILQNSGALKDLELFDLLIESAKELDVHIKAIVNKVNEMDDEVFR